MSAVDTSWLAYVGAYTHLRGLNLAACKNVTDASLWHLLGEAPPRQTQILPGCIS